jgi:cytochrome P450
MPYHQRFVQFSLLDSDGEIHQRLRGQLFKSFTAKNLAGLEEAIQDFVDQLINRLQHKQKIDFVADFAAHIPGYVIGLLLGTPAEDCTQLREWSEKIVQYFDVDRSNQRKQIAETATQEFYQYLLDLKQQRIEKPENDLISRMIKDQALGYYSDDEFISTCMLILMAGHGSTIDVVSSGMHTLLKFPATMQRLRDDLSLLPNAIQEMFRYESPLPFFHRHVLKEVQIRGHHFPAGTTFGLLYGAANRDPLQFENPDQFNIDRTRNRHLAFGRGVHLCLGNQLARLNMKIIFTTLLHRFSDFELIDEPNYKPGLSIRGPQSLNIAWTPNN